MTVYDICLKRQEFVTSNDVIKHILPYISSTEPLINYCIFFKTLNFPVLRDMQSIYPQCFPECSNIRLHHITLHYIILHYITIVFCNLHCIYIRTLSYTKHTTIFLKTIEVAERHTGMQITCRTM